MRSLKELLLHYVQPNTKLLDTERVCAQVVSEVLNIKIQPKDVHYKKNQAFFKVAPTIKTEILLQKEKILKLITENDINVSDVR